MTTLISNLLMAVALLGLTTTMAPLHARELKDLAPKPAPALVLPTLKGATVDLAAYRGKVVLVNFWATWCPPCRKEMPSMNRLVQLMDGQPFVILGVNAGESPESVEAFLMETPVNFPVLLDVPGSTLKPWKAFVFPASFVMDKRGQVRMGLLGSIEWDEPAVAERIQALVSEP